MSTPSLQIHLLGSPQISFAQKPCAVPRSQARALLYRLAVRAVPVQRDHLCFLFWPDLDDTTARRHLTILISHLRRTLPEPDLLLVSPEQVELNPNRVWTDAALFERLCRQINSATGGGDLETAVSLYRGSFLEGFALANHAEYELWVEHERHRFEHSYQQALAALVELKTEQHLHDKAIHYAQQSLHHDPLNEPMHRRLIALYADKGDRNAARRQFERCAAVLEQELGVEPLPETREAYEAAIAHRRAAARTRVQPVPPLMWTTLPSLRLPLTGRSEALHHLRDRLSQAMQGKGLFTFVVGEAGMGKSRLLQEFATQQEDAVLVLAGAAKPGDYGLPYQPLVQALRRGLHLAGKSLTLERAWLSEALLVLPELRSLHPNLPDPLAGDARETRPRLFEALARLLFALAEQAPVLLCLDDLHWTDQTTLEWLAYFAEQLRQPHPVLVVGAYRHEEPDAVMPLRERLRRQGILSEVALTGMSEKEIGEILHHAAFPTEASRSLARTLQKTTGGNAFFLLEMVRTLLEQPSALDVVDGAPSLPLPQTVSEAVHARLRSLSAIARQVLEAGSVAGLDFTLDLVQAAAGRSDLETVEALEELSARFLLRDTKDGYQFHHDIIRTAVYAGMSHGRRKLLHRRLADALVGLHSSEVEQISGQIAAHYEAAGILKMAAPYYRQAAVAARRVYAAGEAIQLCQRLLADDLVVFLQPLDRCQIRLELAEVWLSQGSFGQAAGAARQALQCAEEIGEASWIGRCQQVLANALHLQGGHTEEALGLLQRARALLTQVGDRENLMRVLWTLGELYWFLARAEEAWAVLTEQKEIATELNHPQRLCEALLTLGIVSLIQNRLDVSEEYCQRSFAIAKQVDYRWVMVRAAIILGNVYISRYDAAQAYHWNINVAFAVAHRSGDRQGMGATAGNTAILYWQIGDYEKTRAYCRLGLQLGLEIDDAWGASTALTNIAGTYVEQEDWNKALEILHKVHAVNQTLNSPLWDVEMLLMARCYEARQDYQTAQSYIQRALQVYEEVGGLRRGTENEYLIARVTDLRIQLALGQIDHGTAISGLEQMLHEVSEQKEQALISYNIWRINRVADAHWQRAVDLYRSLYQDHGGANYRRYYEELTGERLPDPPPLFDDDPELPLTPSDLPTLMDQFDQVLARLTAQKTA